MGSPWPPAGLSGSSETQSRGPAILVEVGFLSNANEAARLRNASLRARYAQALAAGVLHGLGR